MDITKKKKFVDDEGREWDLDDFDERRKWTPPAKKKIKGALGDTDKVRMM